MGDCVHAGRSRWQKLKQREEKKELITNAVTIQLFILDVDVNANLNVNTNQYQLEILKFLILLLHTCCFSAI